VVALTGGSQIVWDIVMGVSTIIFWASIMIMARVGGGSTAREVSW